MPDATSAPASPSWRRWSSPAVAVTVSMWAALSWAAPTPPAADTDTGRVTGTREGGLDTFLGLPYAAPPTGPLRWRSPQPAAPWTGVRAATRFAADCMQPNFSAPGVDDARPVSEDCLYLNLWRPATPAHGPRPVMVWIHGGAFFMGSGAEPVFNGANLARRGAVVVTINYRIGRFGFFGHPALTRENADGLLGNYGLMDQMAALRWVRRNIGAFGGDPRNVTVFGESAGASSINALLASPLARGLFDKAVSQSGSGQKRWHLPDVATTDVRLPDAEARGAAWARAVQLGDGGGDPAALRAVPAERVLNVLPPERGEALIVDGRILPRPVDVTFRRGEQASVPYLVGANSYEQSLTRWLPGVVDESIASLGTYRDEAMAMYTAGSTVDDKTAAAALWADRTMVGPARFLARRMAVTGAPTWLYRFSYVPEAMRGKTPGAGHGDEVGFVFDNQTGGAHDAGIARLLADAWVRFAATGNPNRPGATPAWPRYREGEGETQDALLEFTNDGPVVRRHYAKERLDLMDRIYLDGNGSGAP